MGDLDPKPALRQRRPRRPAVDTVAPVAEMVIEIIRLAHESHRRRFAKKKNNNHPGNSMELLLVLFVVMIATAKNKPTNASQIEKALSIPYSNVARHLRELSEVGLITAVGSHYLANVEQLDNDITPGRVKRLADIVLATGERLKPIAEGPRLRRQVSRMGGISSRPAQ